MTSVPDDYPWHLGTWYHGGCSSPKSDASYHSREEQITNISPPLQIQHSRRVIERVVKTPNSKRVGKIVEEDGQKHYFLDGKQVTRQRFNEEQWF